MSAKLMPALEAPLAAVPTVAGLREKIKDLDRQRQQHAANANACTGAIQFAEALIADLEGGADGR